MPKFNNLSKLKLFTQIHELKHQPFGEINIECEFNNLKYNLVLLTSDCADNECLMDILGKWRKENEMWFYSQFEVTLERTTKWFKERVINAPDRLLFLIDVDNEYIGHVGLFRFDFENNTCEIDNIVRGEPKFPGIMENAIKEMMCWGKEVLGLKNYSLQVISDNKKAIKLYHKLSFIDTSRVPLIQVNGNDGMEWTEAPKEYDQNAERYNLIMKLNGNK